MKRISWSTNYVNIYPYSEKNTDDIWFSIASNTMTPYWTFVRVGYDLPTVENTVTNNYNGFNNDLIYGRMFEYSEQYQILVQPESNIELPGVEPAQCAPSTAIIDGGVNSWDMESALSDQVGFAQQSCQNCLYYWEQEGACNLNMEPRIFAGKDSFAAMLSDDSITFWGNTDSHDVPFFPDHYQYLSFGRLVERSDLTVIHQPNNMVSTSNNWNEQFLWPFYPDSTSRGQGINAEIEIKYSSLSGIDSIKISDNPAREMEKWYVDGETLKVIVPIDSSKCANLIKGSYQNDNRDDIKWFHPGMCLGYTKNNCLEEADNTCIENYGCSMFHHDEFGCETHKAGDFRGILKKDKDILLDAANDLTATSSFTDREIDSSDGNNVKVSITAGGSLIPSTIMDINQNLPDGSSITPTTPYGVGNINVVSNNGGTGATILYKAAGQIKQRQYAILTSMNDLKFFNKKTRKSSANQLITQLSIECKRNISNVISDCHGDETISISIFIGPAEVDITSFDETDLVIKQYVITNSTGAQKTAGLKYYVDDEIKLKWTENTKITRDNSEVDSILVCGFSCQNALENYSPPQGVIDDNVITLTSNDISSTEITSVEVDSSGGSGYQV